MTANPGHVRYTPAEYLAMERAAETKSEYLNGEMRPMSREGRVHNLITSGLGAYLSDQLRDTVYETYILQMRVRVSRTGLYTYPDVTVACPPIHFEDDEFDTLLNPVVIAEVLSPSTEAYDRGKKFAQYRQLESLREYVLMAQDEARAERFVRQGDLWVLSEVTGLDAVLSFEAIGCEVRLADIYRRVQFPGDGQQMIQNDKLPSRDG